MSNCMMSKKIQGLTNQGIVTILGSEICASLNSLRRTLSADMSSKKWLSQNGFSPVRKTASSQQLSLPHSELTLAEYSLSSSEEDDEYEEMKEHNENKTEQFDMWSSILFSHKVNEKSSILTITPYVHPMVKRSKSSLSEESLEICTESLGSETGSDGFSSYPSSETGDSKEDKEEEMVKVTVSDESRNFKLCDQMQIDHEELELPKHNCARKKPLPRCFPPPLPSLFCENGWSLHMRSHRDNGRLFLEAVSVPSQNNFSAQRQDGRLVLTYTGHVAEEEEQQEEEKDHVEEFEEEVEDLTVTTEQAPTLSCGITTVHMLSLMTNDDYKQIGLVNWNPKWSKNFNDAYDYEHYWQRNSRAKKAAFILNPFTNLQNNMLVFSGERKETSNGDYFVLNLKTCKDSRRSFLFWEPYCIAT